jgi:hypothetical protein
LYTFTAFINSIILLHRNLILEIACADQIVA